MKTEGDMQYDYDLHGIVGIRLIDASERDIAVVTRQVGPIHAGLTREPDIVIRFVDRLPRSSPVRYLGLEDVGFTDDAFIVLRGPYKSRVRVQIPFVQIGRQCHIVCERGAPAVPLLIPIINVVALTKDVLPLHASAFRYDGADVLVTGWAKGGKTESLLAFIMNGAEYIGDEWVYVTSDGRHMYGIPEPIRVWDWQLRDVPEYWEAISRRDRVRLRVLRSVVAALDRVTTSGLGHGSAPIRLMRRVGALLKRQCYVHLPPVRVFGQKAGSLAGTPDKVFFIASHESDDISVEPADPEDVARRMVFSLQFERREFLSDYLKFRFAFPDAANQFIDEAEELQRQMLTRILANKETYAVYHPYPVSIPGLFDAMQPYVQSADRRTKSDERERVGA